MGYHSMEWIGRFWIFYVRFDLGLKLDLSYERRDVAQDCVEILSSL